MSHKGLLVVDFLQPLKRYLLIIYTYLHQFQSKNHESVGKFVKLRNTIESDKALQMILKERFKEVKVKGSVVTV